MNKIRITFSNPSGTTCIEHKQGNVSQLCHLTSVIHPSVSNICHEEEMFGASLMCSHIYFSVRVTYIFSKPGHS